MAYAATINQACLTCHNTTETDRIAKAQSYQRKAQSKPPIQPPATR